MRNDSFFDFPPVASREFVSDALLSSASRRRNIRETSRTSEYSHIPFMGPASYTGASNRQSYKAQLKITGILMLVISFEVELHRTLILATKTGLN